MFVDKILPLAINEFGQWLYREIDPKAAMDELTYLNSTNRTIVLFSIVNGEVRTVAKPSFYSDEEMSAAVNPIPFRAKLYRDAIQSVAFGLQNTVFAIELEDGDHPTTATPIFSFQKDLGSNNILVPDVDLIYHKYYDGHEYDEDKIFDDKFDKAIFVGSTTGLMINDAVIDNGWSPRLQAAFFFKGHPVVDFRLPNIVMCETQSVEDRLRGLGLGVGHASWREQLEFKYLLSMDGNGATCSRVALGLRSNSVLFKYNSIHQLYYFARLQPWVHYIPISDHHEVEKTILLGRAVPRLFEEIATNGSDFFKNYLAKEPVEAYLKAILQVYIGSGPPFEERQLCALTRSSP